MDPAKGLKGLGQIYLQIKFLSTGMPTEPRNDPAVTDDIEAQIKQKQEKIEGSLYINVIHAKDLLPVDDDASTSDPLVQIFFGEKTVKSKHLNRTLNPVWNFKGNKIDFSVLKDNVPPLILHVIDHNMVLTNSLIGMKEISLTDVFASPGN